MDNVFSSLKIVELASVLAGPAVGTFFSELGAKVTKIENKATGGDITRQWKLPVEDKDAISAYYASVNYHKTIVYKDLRSEEDREDVYNLIRDCDIVIANYKASSAHKIGMDYDQIKKINPNIIYGQINGFESIKNRVAYDAVLQAETGYMSMTGEPNGNPVKMPLAMIDILAAHQLKEGIMVALWKRDRKNASHDGAQYIECSLERVALASLANQAGNYLMADHIAQPMGSQHPNIAPYGEIFYSLDKRPFILAIGSDKQFALFCNLIHLEIEDRFITNKGRVQNREALASSLAPKIANLNIETILNYCIENYIPMGEIKSLDKVLNTRLAKSMILEEDIEGTHTRRMSTVAFKSKP